LPKTKTRLLLSTAIVASGIAAAGAIAQGLMPAPGTYDRNRLPETKRVVKQYVLAPRGNVDGLILQDGTPVNFPAPHLGTEVVFVTSSAIRSRSAGCARA
jgi:hypothetical protein